MWRRLKQWFQRGGGYSSQALRDLKIEPHEHEDFDIDACRRLLTAIADRGGETLESAYGVAVPYELFFEGNRSKGSIAVNAMGNSPYVNAAEFYQFLQQIEAHPEVHSLWVAIADVEPHEDGVLHEWPYSDAMWIYSSLRHRQLLDMLEPIRPDEFDPLDPQRIPKDSVHLRRCQFPLLPIPPGLTAYYAWWD